MRPIRTEDSNFTFTGPAPEIADLPGRREPDAFYSTYELTIEDREKLARGATITLGIHTPGPILPVSFGIGEATVAPGPDDLRCLNCWALYLAERGLQECGQCGGELVLDGMIDRAAFTYKERLVVRNHAGRKCLATKGGCGEVHDYLTARDCKPAVWPDHMWRTLLQLGPVETLPPEVEGIEIGEKLPGDPEQVKQEE